MESDSGHGAPPGTFQTCKKPRLDASRTRALARRRLRRNARQFEVRANVPIGPRQAGGFYRFLQSRAPVALVSNSIGSRLILRFWNGKSLFTKAAPRYGYASVGRWTSALQRILWILAFQRSNTFCPRSRSLYANWRMQDSWCHAPRSCKTLDSSDVISAMNPPTSLRSGRQQRYSTITRS